MRLAGFFQFLRVVRVFRVAGASMQPTLIEGDIVVSTPIPYLLRKPRAGDIIVVLHPFIQKKLMIKRIASVFLKGKKDVSLFIEGDERTSSEDSHSFGALSQASVIGKVIYVARNHSGQKSH